MLGKLYRTIKKYKNINWTFADQAIVSGTNFLFGVLVARFVGVDEFGLFTLAWLLISFVSMLQNALILSPMMSIGPKVARSNEADYFSTVIIQQLVFSIFSSCLLFVLLDFNFFSFINNNLQKFALELSLASFFAQSQEFIRRYYLTKHEYINLFYNDLVCYSSRLMLLLFFIFFFEYEKNALNVIVIVIVSLVLASFCGIKLFGKIRIPNKYFIEVFVSHWNFSSWLTISAVFQWFTGNVIFIIIETSLGTLAVGAFKAVQQLIGVTNVFFQALVNYLPSRAAKKLNEDGSLELVKYLKRIFILSQIPSLLFVLIIVIAPEYWLGVFYGDAFESYGLLFSILSLSILLQPIGLVVGTGLKSFEKTSSFLFGNIVAFTMVVVLCFPVVELSGMVGLSILVLFASLAEKMMWYRSLRSIYFSY